MTDAPKTLPCWTLPKSASASLAKLALKHFTSWEVGVGNGCLKDAQGAPQRTADGRLATVAYEREQSDLVGDVRVWKPCDEGYPRLQGGAVCVRATFDPDEANIDLTEVAVRATDPDTGERVLFSRLPGDHGTKRGGEWYEEIVLVF